MYIKLFKIRIIILTVVLTLMSGYFTTELGLAVSDRAVRNLPSNYGKLYVRVWRGDGKESGNTRKWDYLVSAKYLRRKKKVRVKSIRISWQGGASLRNGASISLGISDSGVSVGAYEKWTYVKTKVKYWINTKGQNNASYRSNLVAAPSQDYKRWSVWLINTGKLRIKGDKRSWEYSAAV